MKFDGIQLACYAMLWNYSNSRAKGSIGRAPSLLRWFTLLSMYTRIPFMPIHKCSSSIGNNESRWDSMKCNEMLWNASNSGAMESIGKAPSELRWLTSLSMYTRTPFILMHKCSNLMEINEHQWMSMKCFQFQPEGIYKGSTFTVKMIHVGKHVQEDSIHFNS